jgi:hypothetical protein
MTALAAIATAILAIVVCVISGASDEKSPATKHARVVGIQVSSLPESPVLDWSPARPGWDAVVASLPALPPPLSPRSCKVGPALTVAFADGSSTTYACALPTAIRHLRDRLIAQAAGTPNTSAQRAENACRAAAPHDFVNAQPTTVGDIHAITGGPRADGHPWSNVLANVPGTAFAAWCWRQPTPETYVSYVVGPSGQIVHLNVSTHGPPAPLPGPEPIT